MAKDKQPAEAPDTIPDTTGQPADNQQPATDQQTTSQPVIIVNAEVVKFPVLESKLADQHKAEVQTRAGELISKGLFAEASAVLSSAYNGVLQEAMALPKYILYTLGSKTYLVEMPDNMLTKKPATSTTGSTGKKGHDFKSGDMIRLEHDNKFSETYKYTDAGLIDSTGQPVKASEAVKKFMIEQMGATRPFEAGFKGYAGLSHGYWKVVQPATEQPAEQTTAQ